MKILLGVHQFFPDWRNGTEVLTLELARGLSARGHSIEILTGFAEPKLPESARPRLAASDYEGLPVHQLHYGKATTRDPVGLNLSAPERVALALEVVSRVKPDLVHFNHVIGFSADVIPSVRSMGIPVVFSPTDYWTVCPIQSLFRHHRMQVCLGPDDPAECLRCSRPMPQLVARLAVRLARWPLTAFNGKINSVSLLETRAKQIVSCLNAADRILPATRFLAETLLRHGAEESRIHVVPYGVDIGHLPDKTPVPATFSPETPLQLGFIGRFHPLKGPDCLLDSLRLLQDEDRRRVSLSLYGQLDEGDPYHASLRQKSVGLEQVLHWRGTFPHDNIGTVLRGLHLLVVPSIWYESTPLVLCSALAAGIPVAVSNLGGMTEILETGVNGFSFAPGNPSELAQLISEVLKGEIDFRGLYEDLKPRGRSTSDYATDILDVYHEVLSTSQTGKLAAKRG